MDLIQLKLCDIQGRLFELSLQAGYDSEDFMKRFMRSKVHPIQLVHIRMQPLHAL